MIVIILKYDNSKFLNIDEYTKKMLSEKELINELDSEVSCFIYFVQYIYCIYINYCTSPFSRILSIVILKM